MSALFIGAGTALVGTAFSVEQGLSQKHKANQIEKNLKQPQYQIPDEFYQNRNISRQMAQLGLPSQQYNNQMNQINANQASSLATAQRSANPGAGIANITGQTNAATNNLNAEDSQARQSNQRYYMQANDQLGGQKLAQQQANVFDPYTQKYNEMQAYRGAGQQNINTAVQDLSQLGGYAMQYGLNPNSGGMQAPQAGNTFANRGYNPQLSAQGMGLPPTALQNQLFQ
jgi:hypothetical protein